MRLPADPEEKNFPIDVLNLKAKKNKSWIQKQFFKNKLFLLNKQIEPVNF